MNSIAKVFCLAVAKEVAEASIAKVLPLRKYWQIHDATGLRQWIRDAVGEVQNKMVASRRISLHVHKQSNHNRH